jgi:Immunity protein 8
MVIGYEGFDGGDLFQMTVCTPAWISREHPEEIAVFGTRLLIVFRYDWPTIHAAIKNIVSRYTADNWCSRKN